MNIKMKGKVGYLKLVIDAYAEKRWQLFLEIFIIIRNQ